MGLTDDDFVEVPVLYESIGMAKTLPLHTTPGFKTLLRQIRFFYPDPEGPIDPDDGRGVWRRVTRMLLKQPGTKRVCGCV